MHMTHAGFSRGRKNHYSSTRDGDHNLQHIAIHDNDSGVGLANNISSGLYTGSSAGIRTGPLAALQRMRQPRATVFTRESPSTEYGKLAQFKNKMRI